MEVYILDNLLRRETVIDLFESLIWTERFREAGEFELDILSTFRTRALLRPGVKLAMNLSHRIMTVETVARTTSTDGLGMLKVKGNSIESILEDRTARASMTTSTWTITAAPANVARKIFHDICVMSVLSPAPYFYDKIPFVVESTFMPTGNIPEPIDPITVNLPVQSVYQSIKDICDVWTLGFRLLRNDVDHQLYWDVYTGSDRTSGQSLLNPVIFAPELDNLQNTSELNSIEKSKNVAYVFTPNGHMVVYPLGVPEDTSGFDRRVLHVDATDITLAAGVDLDAAMLQRGREELAKNATIQAFDGEINQNSQYKYETDYFLGDLVEVRNGDGIANYMRVTEQIFVGDKEGDRTYPTLAMNQFINTGSWLSWTSNITWLDMNADPTTWVDQP